MKNTVLDNFIKINTIEGTSYLILIFIAMPLKYILHYDIATKIVGMIHGILFVIFILLLLFSIQKYKFDLKLSIIFFIASLIPFGTIYNNKKLKKMKFEIKP